MNSNSSSALPRLKPSVCAMMMGLGMGLSGFAAQAEIAATHIYHNHMPNFWPFYDVSQYDQTAVGAPIRYMYDGQVKQLKQNPPAGYTFYIPGSGLPMPHDDLESYYAHHAKVGAYQTWPMNTAIGNHGRYPMSQTHVTMSASVINNVQSFAELGNQADYNLGWGDYWRSTQQSLKTTNGFNALDTIHFSGHHTMGPLVGNDFFLKDLIFQNVTLAQPYFMGDSFRSSKGFFPTELGFSERIIPVLAKLGIEWSVLGNVHYSRTLKDYPYLNDPGVDTLVSPPNRADLQNESNVGEWVSLNMFNEQQVTHNKFPFASIPHWVQSVNPETGEVYKVAGIPVEQASSWEEGYVCYVTSKAIKGYESEASSLGRTQYFVIAHDGDNSQGCAGDSNTWNNSGNVTYADGGVTGMGVDEYLRAYPIPADDIVHVQDGSWIDTRDSSADPTWYHWHLPMGVWNGQLAAFNQSHGTDYEQLYAANGDQRRHMVSLELGYHYLERNFALQQAAENYAKTAEQIWLDDHPNYWQPSTTLDNEVTYPGNQLNPWMLSYPVKGDANNDYAGGANPAELAWYFLIASIDSGFGYYDENVDDGVKPTISFNQSLYFSEPYVQANIAKDRTGPSLWWPQRYPYNPGSANASKAEGWAKMYMNNTFAIYTYAYDVNDVADIQVKVRVHTSNSADPKDKTYQLYDPAAHASDPNVNPANVGAWQSYAMTERDLGADINGVDWQPSSTATFQVVPAQKIGNLYYTYFDNYREQLLDYYIEATDSKGNVTKSPIQQVYVGAGRYTMSNGKQVEKTDGDIVGEEPFFTRGGYNRKPVAVITPGEDQTVPAGTVVTLYATDSSDPDGEVVEYQWSNGEWSDFITVTVDQSQTISLTVVDDKGATSTTSVRLRVEGDTSTANIYYQDTRSWGQVCLHYSIDGGASWTTPPGEPMTLIETNWYKKSIDLEDDMPLTFVASDCSSQWDNNGGQNYTATEGDWQISGGVLAAGVPDDILTNLPPVAVITPGSQAVRAGTIVTLSAAGSTDPDGSIASYEWSTGAVSNAITVEVNPPQSFSVVVTDNEGATATATVDFTLATNQAPSIVITPPGGSYKSGTVVTLDASQTTDPDGDEMSFLWSTGETTTSIQVTVDAAKTIGLTVSDALGASANAEVSLSVDDTFEQNFASLYYRGTSNSWAASAMELVADNTWQLDVVLTGTGDNNGGQRFKLDVKGDWTQNYGDNGSDGVLDPTGADIAVSGSGTYRIVVNDQTLNYTVTKLSGGLEKNFTSLYVRGSFNGWACTEMTLVDDYTWQADITFTGEGDANGAQRFKVDQYCDWTSNWGDTNSDGVLEQTGGDIAVSGVGVLTLTVNDQTLSYSLQ